MTYHELATSEDPGRLNVITDKERKEFWEFMVEKASLLDKIRAGNDLEITSILLDIAGKKMTSEYVILDIGRMHICLKESRDRVGDSGLGKIIKAKDIQEQIMEFWEKGYDAGLAVSAWPELSKKYRVAKRELNIITGIPGHGKSEWIDDLFVNLAIDYGYHFAIFSPENFPLQMHFSKLAEKYTKMPFHAGPGQRIPKDSLPDAISWVDKHFSFIHPHEDFISLKNILSLATKIKPDGLIIDPWNEIEHQRPAGITETDYISECLSMLRRWARVNNIAVWLVAHPQKLQKDKDGQTPIPTPYSISGSAHWFNKADNCITIHREPDNSVMVYIQKIKFKIRGEIGNVAFNYDKVTGTYTEKPETKPGNIPTDEEFIVDEPKGNWWDN